MKLFNHRDPELSRIQTFKGPIMLTGLEDYLGRTLAITSPEDVVQLPSSLEEQWGWITSHYNRIGLACAHKVVWNTDFSVATSFSEHEVSVFIFCPEVAVTQPDRRWQQVVDLANSKNKFLSYCKELGIPIPQTMMFNNLSEVTPDVMDAVQYPLYLKAATSVSGLGVVFCQSPAELKENLSRLSQGPFQIQQALETSVFLNMTYCVENGNAVRIVSTKQILDGCAHNGNVFPSGEIDPWDMTDYVAKMLTNSGMKGTFGFDIAITQQGPFMIECNPRFNGSVYPAIAAQKLGVTEWCATNYPTQFKSLDDIHLGVLEFDPKSKQGVVLINWGTIRQGKVGVLIAGNQNQRQIIDAGLRKVL